MDKYVFIYVLRLTFWLWSTNVLHYVITSWIFYSNRRKILYWHAKIYSYLLRTSTALASCMVLNFIQITIWNITYVGFAAYIYTFIQIYMGSCCYSTFVMLHPFFCKRFGRCRNDCSLSRYVARLADSLFICFLSYMLYIFCRVIRPGPFLRHIYF